jgi:hypothetical protein
MQPPLSRPLEPAELAAIDDVLQRLKDHFHQWRRAYVGFDHHLVEFAFYEGCGGTDCCGAILAEAAPLALGTELVLHYDFSWPAVRQGDQWHFAVTHPSLAEPIDLMTLEDGRYDTDSHDHPPHPGQLTYQSLDGILNAVGLRRKWNR